MPGKFCRKGRFVPVWTRRAFAAPIQKRELCQGFKSRARLGTPFA
jgi:hypothetical protein